MQTWRELLGKIISDSYERQRIAETLDVHPVTLLRWSTGKSRPRLETLRQLLEAVPRYRQELVLLMQQEFPVLLTSSDAHTIFPQDIPSIFYSRVLKAYTTSLPLLRTSSICIFILQQVLIHLDPGKTGMAAVISQCIPPSPGHKVRSLRTIFGRGTPPWGTHLENRTLLLGAESLAGHAVLSGRTVVLQRRDDILHAFTTHPVSWEESALACPLLISDRVLGCLYLSSTRPHHFSQAHQDLVRRYADLLVLAFDEEQFYSLADLALGILPPYHVQRDYLVHFHQRVTERMVQNAHNAVPLRRPQAETMVWQELEEVLLTRLFL